MKVTKFVHSCLLVETADRTALFDPGVMSKPAFDFDNLEKLDDIFITHGHPDHLDADFIKQLIDKFPTVRITGPNQVVEMLAKEGIKATTTPPAGVEFFEAPHEPVEPLFWQPENTGFHYLDKLSNPGDSHSFKETKAILALPVTAPWGAAIKAVNLALELKPQYVLPIHDWHWSDEARQGMYDGIEGVLSKQGITFCKLQTGRPADLAV
jgi:L-ascorbate metabolism protein UlaG (beta-lactamase superfamily)